jgi:ABC-type thiamin/hydroxymethylpyrimidine transport system permease subunit
MSQAAITQKSFQRFTAVDLVTIAVFGTLWRAMWYVWNAFAFLFPFNQVLNTLFGVLCVVTALVIVRKVGTATLLNIAAGLVNLFLQGEVFTVVIIGATTGILADLYCYLVLQSGRDPFRSLRHMFIAGTLTAVLHNFILWIIMLKFVFKVPMANSLVAAVFAAGTAGGIIGGLAGFGLGDRIKGLLG